MSNCEGNREGTNVPELAMQSLKNDIEEIACRTRGSYEEVMAVCRNGKDIENDLNV